MVSANVSSVETECWGQPGAGRAGSSWSGYVPVVHVMIGGRTTSFQSLLRRGRSKEVVDEVLGESFGGILISTPPTMIETEVLGPLHIHKLKVLYPEDGGLTQWALGVRLYAKGRECGGRGTPSVPGATGAGGPVAGAVPSIPGRPVGGASQALPAD